MSILKTGGLSSKFLSQRHIICWGKCLKLSDGGGLPHTASNTYSANVCIILKIKNWEATIFQKPLHFWNFSYISTILGLPQGFDEQNCSSIKNSTKELPRLLGFVKFAKFPNGLSRLVNEWNIRIHVPKFRRWLLRNHKWEAWA